MAGTLTAAGKNYVLDNGVPGTTYLQLHTGDPTDAGTSNVSTITGRKSLTMGSASSGNKANSSTAQWAAPNGISGTETLSHYSIWTASSGGTCLSTGTLTASLSGRTTADTINVAAGDIDFDLANP